jgi:hypothetical protein
VFELVVDNGEQGGAVVFGFDAPGHPAYRLGGEVGMVEAAVADDQAVRRVGVQHRVVAPQRAAIRGVVAKWRTGPGGRLNERAEEVPGAVFGFGDRLPDLPWGGADEQVIGLRRRYVGLGHRYSLSRCR